VFVHWNTPGELNRALESLSGQELAGQKLADSELEVIVVDNGSKHPPAADRLRADTGLAVTVIDNRRNVGLAPANNQGVAASSGEFVLLANPDVEFERGAVAALVSSLQRHPRAAFAIPRLVHPDGRHQPSAGDLPTPLTALLGTTLARRRRHRAGERGLWWPEAAHHAEQAIPRGAEACYLVRRAAIDDLGPQDPRYRLDWEAIDWFDRAGRRGWETWLVPDAVVIHKGGASIRQVPLRWVLQSHRGMYLYLSQRSPAWSRGVLLVAVTLRGALKALAVAARLPAYRWAQG
jgi:GT2 family glycosyltransferase